MALEPDITIEENRNYATIKGGLKLSGEYKPVEGAEASDYSHAPGVRTVDDITETDVGTALMDHHFPVDITIPSNRISDIENIFVTVESFDYSLPERGCIQLEADIAITGLAEQIEYGHETMRYDEYNEENEEIVEEEEEDSADSAYPEAIDDHEDSGTNTYEDEISPEINMRYSDADDGDEDETVQFGENDSVEDDPYDEDDGQLSHNITQFPFQDKFQYEAYRDPEEEEAAEGPHIDLKKRKEDDDVSLNEFEEAREEKTKHPYQTIPTPAVPVSDTTDMYEHELEEKADSGADQAELENEPENSAKKPGRREENALYLTSMLTNENERFSRVKMCIVQGGDSLETISERYKVPVSSILRKNQLDSDVIDEGQVLYIPVTSKS
ncbi:stage VI sporulation protein D [Scopulibacillus darangshiensis]|uniref:Stage VI sporulation protein D n=2 Tax=Scopulibacillus darangshiensis TaxID=442528 RepID=A0A4V2SNS7_9BACL|nr:stage VI sporulation protein D [Scopulibacillus darangshiensis]